MNHHSRRAQDGSVLMETVIAIPIFLVVIGWTLWMGMLSQGRSRLLMSDRYAAWNAGNRHGGAAATPGEVQTRLFSNEAGQDITDVKIRDMSSGWYTEVEGTAKSKFAMPAWVEGMVHAGTTWNYVPVKEQQRMTGRDDPHLIVMRGGGRDQAKEDVNWIQVRGDNWWPNMRRSRGGGGGKFAKQDYYERFGTFVVWSD